MIKEVGKYYSVLLLLLLFNYFSQVNFGQLLFLRTVSRDYWN